MTRLPQAAPAARNSPDRETGGAWGVEETTTMTMETLVSIAFRSGRTEEHSFKHFADAEEYCNKLFSLSGRILSVTAYTNGKERLHLSRK